MLHVPTLLMDLYIKIAHIIIIPNYFIKILNHLQLPHDDSIIILIIITNKIKEFSGLGI